MTIACAAGRRTSRSIGTPASPVSRAIPAIEPSANGRGGMADAPAGAEERGTPAPRRLHDHGRDGGQVIGIERMPQPDEKAEPAARQQREHASQGGYVR